MPSPILHAFDSERRPVLKIPSNIPFYEEIDILECAMGNADGREPDDEHRRHDYDGDQSRQRRAHVEVQLRSHDRPAPARVRKKAGQLRAFMLHASGRIQLRPGCRALGIMAACRTRSSTATARRKRICLRRKSPSPWQRLRAGSIRLAGQLRECQRHIVPVDRHVPRARRCAAACADHRNLPRRRLQWRIRPFNPRSWQPSKTIANGLAATHPFQPL